MADDVERALTFTVPAIDRIKIREWLANGRHLRFCRDGVLTYQFTPNGIGDGIRVRCACQKELDLTDVSSW